MLESDPHPPGTIEHLYLLTGELEITAGEETRTAQGRRGHPLPWRPAAPAGQYRHDDAHAHMILVLKTP